MMACYYRLFGTSGVLWRRRTDWGALWREDGFGSVVMLLAGDEEVMRNCICVLSTEGRRFDDGLDLALLIL